jgi:hypothetical protein
VSRLSRYFAAISAVRARSARSSVATPDVRSGGL